MARVWVAMSGGVDSSVAAALLMEQGHDVTGVTMQLWASDEEGACCSNRAVRDARRVCDLLGVPHYVLNFREAFERSVVAPFAAEYAAGRTPNPCVACNDRLKFSNLLAKARTQGAEMLATGHYARVGRDAEGVQLLRAVDPAKDQSYFLYRLTAEQLQHVIFPVGELAKSDVRSFAERFGLPVADKAESQDTCFEVGGSYEPVIAERAPSAFVPGDIVDRDGRIVGRHAGIGHYTVGQRRGLGVGGLDQPLYVVRLDAAANRVVVGPREALRVTRIEAAEPVWPHSEGEDVQAEVMVRYRMCPVPAVVRLQAGRLLVSLDAPLEGVAPGQSLVCYRGEVVVGGGVIECAS